MSIQRDIIVVIGPIASGKTYTVNYLRTIAKKYHIPMSEETLSDGNSLIPNMEKDDETGGFYHYHDWCLGNIEGHTHAYGGPKLPVVFYGNKIPDAMYHDLFEKLHTLPYTGQLYVVEVAGGLNTNPVEFLESQINYSFKRLGKMLDRGAFCNSWLSRVYAVIHPRTDLSLRYTLNNKREVILPEEVKNGIHSAPTTVHSMEVTGGDDFEDIQGLFQKADVKHMFTAQNSGNELYNEKLEIIGKTLFHQFPFSILKNRAKEDRDIVFVVGRSGSGKKTIIKNFYNHAEKQKILFPNYISDFDFFLKKVREDDEKGGFNHYHTWNKEKFGGHTHRKDQPVVPFIITSDQLIKDSFGEYFHQLTNLPKTGQLWFVEWSGGVNGNPSYEPASRLDISFDSLSNSLKNGMYTTDWLHRVYAVIHPMVNDTSRMQLNECEETIILEDIKKEEVSSKERNATVLSIYEKDDFFTVEKFFHEAHVPQIHHFEFSSKEKLIEQSQHIGDLLFDSYS